MALNQKIVGKSKVSRRVKKRPQVENGLFYDFEGFDNFIKIQLI